MESLKPQEEEEDKVLFQDEENKEFDLFQQLDQDKHKLDQFMHENHIRRSQTVYFKKALNHEVDEKEILRIPEVSETDSNSMEDDNVSQSSEPSTTDEELYKYIQEMIDMINTEDEQLNKENMDMLVQQISTKLKEQGIQHDRAQILKFLDEMKKEIDSPAATPEEKKKKMKKLTEQFYQVGYIGYYTATKGEQAAATVSLGLTSGTASTLSTQLLSKTAWIAGAFIYTAQTGLNYRKMKKGNIDKKEFWRRTKLGSFTTVASIAGGAGGCAAGFAIGTAILPGIGSIVGTVVGGLAGGILGEKATTKAYNKIEKKMQLSKERKLKLLKEKSDNLEIIREKSRKYMECLIVLGFSEDDQNPSLEVLEEAYIQRLDELNEQKASIVTDNEEDIMKYSERYSVIINAFEDAKQYLGDQKPEEVKPKRKKRWGLF